MEGECDNDGVYSNSDNKSDSEEEKIQYNQDITSAHIEELNKYGL